MSIRRARHLVFLAVVACVAACNPPPQRTPEEVDRARPPEATSLLGEPLRAPILDGQRRETAEANLAQAQAQYEKTPNEADTIIWLGRRTAYLNRFKDAIDIYALGINKHPGDARFYRHRGHRYLTLRRLDDAIADLEKAASLIAGTPDQIEPDGLPNARNQPTSTLQSNIWYHLGLAYYLEGDFPSALRAYRECMLVSKNPDMLVATTYWLYMTLRRLNQDADAAATLAPITRDMDIIENQAYHRLLLMFQDAETPDAVWQSAQEDLDKGTIGYGIGNWHLLAGRQDEAITWFRRALDDSPWPAFGAIAAEAELQRLGAGRASR